MLVHFQRSLVFLVPLSLNLLAQGTANRPSPTTGAAAGTSTNPSSIGRGTPNSPSTTQPSTTSPDMRPIYISGKVTLDDGSPPPESLVMKLACNGSPRAIGYTDTKGHFSIDLTSRNNTAMYTDASQDSFGRFGSAGGSPTSRNTGATGAASMGLSGCELSASLAGFRSDRVNLTNRHSLDNPDVGTIFLHRMGNVEGLTISATSAMAPKDARKAYEKGLNEAKKEKWDNAERDFGKAVETYPKYAAAWYQLGLAQDQLKRTEEAKKSYSEALKSDSKFVPPRLQLASLAARESKWEDVASISGEVLRLNPIDFPQAFYFNAMANYQLKNIDVAEKSASDGLKADGAHAFPRLELILGIIEANKGQYPAASQHLNNYLKLAPNANDVEQVKGQLAKVDEAMKTQSAK